MEVIELDSEYESSFSDSDYEVVDTTIFINNIVYLGLLIFLFNHKIRSKCNCYDKTISA